jgi:Zn-dependent peptidase ImmA (M78 family)/DNA-binding XRE family transcriptional regulator
MAQEGSIGERIKLARMSAGLNQRQLAKEMGISAMAISKYETGVVVPNSRVLIQLSRILHVPLDFFFRSIEVTLSEPQYRCRKALKKSEEKMILSKTRDWLERYLEIELITGESKALDLPSGESCTVSSLLEVEDAAQYIRDYWNLGLDPIENVMDVLEQHGIRVCLVEASEAFDALTFYYDGHTPVIVINRLMSGDRQRFTLAHELGHLLLRCEGDIDHEKAMQRFAGAFLVPKPMAFMELGKKRNTLDLNELQVLKQKYGMSMAAWIFRATDLGILDPATARRYWMFFKKMGYHKEEPFKPVPAEKPTHMVLLILRAFSEKRITMSRLKELLGHDWEQLNEVRLPGSA